MASWLSNAAPILIWRLPGNIRRVGAWYGSRRLPRRAKDPDSVMVVACISGADQPELPVAAITWICEPEGAGFSLRKGRFLICSISTGKALFSLCRSFGDLGP
jgi:hypothetical protein